MIRHYSRHLNWPWVVAIWFLFGAIGWGNPKWWLCAILAVTFPFMAAFQGHLMGCHLDKRLEKQ